MNRAFRFGAARRSLRRRPKARAGPPGAHTRIRRGGVDGARRATHAFSLSAPFVAYVLFSSCWCPFNLCVRRLLMPVNLSFECL